MLLPTTHQAAITLLILALICLGSWPNFINLSKWRFELFYFDFAAGAIIIAVLAAMTLGTLGSELSFNDRIAVAGLRSQALVIGGGFVFGVGNLLLVAALSMVGIAASIPLALSIALIVAAAADWQASHWLLPFMSIITLLCAVISSAIAASKRVTLKKAPKAVAGRATKGIVLAILGGIMIGASNLLAEGGLWGDLGLGAYAGLLMFCIGLVVSTAIFNLFFMNIGIDGGRATFGVYFGGGFRQHLAGMFGGMLWSFGTLATLLAKSVPTVTGPGQMALMLYTQSSALVAFAWGVLVWREFAGAARDAKLAIALTGLFFAAGLVLLAYRFQP